MRKRYLDWMRTFLTVYVIIYHVVRAFDYTANNLELTDRRLDQSGPSVQFESFSRSISQTIMSGLFFVSGVSVFYAMRSPRLSDQMVFLKKRVKKLLIPFASGVLVFCFLGEYILERWLLHSSSLSMGAYWVEFVRAPRWGHLWYLLYLLVYSVMDLGLFACGSAGGLVPVPLFRVYFSWIAVSVLCSSGLIVHYGGPVLSWPLVLYHGVFSGIITWVVVKGHQTTRSTRMIAFWVLCLIVLVASVFPGAETLPDKTDPSIKWLGFRTGNIVLSLVVFRFWFLLGYLHVYMEQDVSEWLKEWFQWGFPWIWLVILVLWGATHARTEPISSFHMLNHVYATYRVPQDRFWYHLGMMIRNMGLYWGCKHWLPNDVGRVLEIDQWGRPLFVIYLCHIAVFHAWVGVLGGPEKVAEWNEWIAVPWLIGLVWVGSFGVYWVINQSRVARWVFGV